MACDWEQTGHLCTQGDTSSHRYIGKLTLSYKMPTYYLLTIICEKGYIWTRQRKEALNENSKWVKKQMICK